MRLSRLIRSAARKAVTWIGNPVVSGHSSTSTAAERVRYNYELGDPLQVALVMACVKWLGRVVNEAPFLVITRDSAGREKSRKARHPALNLLRKPNGFYLGAALFKALAASWVLSGNAYVLKRRDSNTEVRELWYEPHFTIRARWPGDNQQQFSTNRTPMPAKRGPGSEFVSFYELWRPSEGNIGGNWDTRIEVDDVIHLRDGLSPNNPRYGINGLASVLAELLTDVQRAHFAATVLANLGMIPFVISPRETDQHITEKQAEKMQAELTARSRTDRGKPLVAGRAIRVDELGFSPQEMDLKSLAAVSEERVASVIGPNAYVLGFIPERNVFSNFAEARDDAYESYLVPLLTYWAQQLTEDLLGEMVDLEKDDGATAIENDWSKVAAMQPSIDRLYLRVGRAFRDGVIKRNSALTEIGMPVDPDPERDDVYVTDLPSLAEEWIDNLDEPNQLDAGDSGEPMETPERGQEPAVSQEKLEARRVKQPLARPQPGRGKTRRPGAKLTDADGNDRPLPGRSRGPALGGKEYGPAAKNQKK